MQEIRQYLKNNILIADGATGTYLSSLTGRNVVACETLNRSDPELVCRVHREYVQSGSRLILTNTFGANTYSLNLHFDRIADILKSGVEIARKGAGNQAYVAADIGPISGDGWDDDQIFEEYRNILDVFLREGMRLFQFETFSEPHSPVMMAEYIRSKVPDAFINVSFAVSPDGRSRMGISGESLLEAVKSGGLFDSAGFNCCSGPAHLLSLASGYDYGTLIPTIKPNAGYPEQEDDVLVYSGMPDYFAKKMAQAPGHGFRIIGGCCGTTPEHIRLLSENIYSDRFSRPDKAVGQPSVKKRVAGFNDFSDALKRDRKKVIAELDPPFDSDLSKLEEAAGILKAAGTDAVTIADSPMARPRADSMLVAARLKRKTGIDVIPHICCRDKNINALKSTLIAGHMEKIRNVLAVTGDPVPDTNRSVIKSVFNLNSAGLCGLIGDLNGDIFNGDPMIYGCAFNVNARNINEELFRLDKKIAAGASFMLTQPVFSDASIHALRKAAGSRKIKIFAGILTPVSYRNIQFLANEIPGFVLPENFVNRFSPDMTREEGEQTGIGISLEIAERAAPYADGFYFMTPFNRVSVTVRLIELLKSGGIL